MKNKFLVSILIIFTCIIASSYRAFTQSNEEDFEWLVVFSFSPSDKDPEHSLQENNNGDGGCEPYSGDFHEGLAIVEAYGKGGYINKEGKLVIKFQSGICRDFHEGFAAIKKNDLWGYIDREGKVIIKPQFLFNNGSNFSDGLATTGQNSYINKEGKILIKLSSPPEYSTDAFSEGLAVVMSMGLAGFINKQGKFVFKIRSDAYPPISDFHNGLARVAIDEDVYYIDNLRVVY